MKSLRRVACHRIAKSELLEIFPEARSIIPGKIREWQIRERQDESRRARAYQLIPDESFSRIFWRQVYDICLHDSAAGKHIRRLRAFPLNGTKTLNLDAAKSVPIRSLFDFQKLRKVGGRHTALCPFHADRRRPSFVIYPDNTFHCFGCGAHGDSVDFFQKLTGCSFKETVKALTT